MSKTMPEGLSLLEQKKWFEDQAKAIEAELMSNDARVALALHVYKVLGIDGGPNDPTEKARADYAARTLDEMAEDSEGARNAVTKREEQLTQARSRASQHLAAMKKLALVIAEKEGIQGDDKARADAVYAKYGIGDRGAAKGSKTAEAPSSAPNAEGGGHPQQ